MDTSDRHTRQRRLPEVGEAGQARLAQSSLTIAAGSASLTELSYLERAGVGQLVDVRVGPALDTLPVLAAEEDAKRDAWIADQACSRETPPFSVGSRRRAAGSPRGSTWRSP